MATKRSRQLRARKILERLYREHAARVFTYASQAIGDASAAEDVIQEAFIRAFGALARGRYEQRGKELAWLLAIARNAVRDHLARGRPRHASLGELQEAADDAAMVEESDLLRFGLGKLRSIERDVVIMRHYLNMSFEEIADCLGLPGGTARSHMCRALDKLAKLLKKELST